jgi:dTDP-D-glucose 4,6-dehydratase
MDYRTLVDFKEGLRRTVEWYRREFPSADAAQARG